MRYRMLDANGDYTFGVNGTNFYVNTPAAVAQAVKTRLGLIQGEWFLDQTAGTPYQQVLGKGTQNTRDAAIQNVISQTQGVLAVLSYASAVNATTRKFTVSAVINTIYGQTSLTYTF